MVQAHSLPARSYARFLRKREPGEFGGTCTPQVSASTGLKPSLARSRLVSRDWRTRLQNHQGMESLGKKRGRSPANFLAMLWEQAKRSGTFPSPGRQSPRDARRGLPGYGRTATRRNKKKKEPSKQTRGMEKFQSRAGLRREAHAEEGGAPRAARRASCADFQQLTQPALPKSSGEREGEPVCEQPRRGFPSHFTASP